jgi:hypothetical protein
MLIFVVGSSGDKKGLIQSGNPRDSGLIAPAANNMVQKMLLSVDG